MKLILLIAAIITVALTFLLCLIDPTFMVAKTGDIVHLAEFTLVGVGLFFASFLPLKP